MVIRRWFRRLAIGAAGLVGVLVVSGVALWLAARPALGTAPTGARLARMQASPQWNGTGFGNVRARVDAPPRRMLAGLMFDGSKYSKPDAPIQIVPRRRADYDSAPASGLRVTWLGHSTLLLEIDGKRVLMDPVWGKFASPFTFMGPRRFFDPPLPLDQLPPIDVVLISHDHYDHLDTPTIRALAARDVKFAVPLGVGAHLEGWGVAPERITELDWWDTTSVRGLRIAAVPARHFSGRSLNDAVRTLWAGFVVMGEAHRVYYSGDTALDDAMLEIGRRYGPFELTMIEVGAYSPLWTDVHLGPEQAVQVHRLVRGDVMLPVHWGMFDLALHGWTEPIERVLVAAAQHRVRVATPRPGDRVEPAAVATSRWWPRVPWQTAAQSPARSSGVAHLMTESAVPPRP
jgi:L-ascorbate metabolism protein UlaG (beta-lactamase superfamily)